MSRRILVPVDDSPQAWDALEYALEQFPDAGIVVLTVLDPVEAMLSGDGPTAPDHSRAEEKATAILEEAADVASVFDADLTTVRESGRPAKVIVSYVEEGDVDHVVMGSHGRSGLSRILLGSTAERVVRRSPVPVTIIRGSD